MSTFSERLKELRTQKGLTQKQVADHLKITVTAYQNYEYGNRDMNIKSLWALADHFDVNVDYLIGRSDNPNRT